MKRTRTSKNRELRFREGCLACKHPCDANRMAYGQIPLYPAFILANENGRKSREDRVTLVCNYSPTLGRTDAWPSCYSVSPFVYRTNTPHRHYLPHLSSSSSFLHHLRLVRIRKKRREEKKIFFHPRASRYDRNYLCLQAVRSDAKDVFFPLRRIHTLLALVFQTSVDQYYSYHRSLLIDGG